MWPDELLCGTGRGRAGASSQPADHAQEAPKDGRTGGLAVFLFAATARSQGGTPARAAVSPSQKRRRLCRASQGRLLLGRHVGPAPPRPALSLQEP